MNAAIKYLGGNKYQVDQETGSLSERDKVYVKIKTTNNSNDSFVWSDLYSIDIPPQPAEISFFVEEID